jgi:predicted RNase H-like nuclease (RuvC/YqgF family)
MEINTCEEYVLNELEKNQNKVIELEDKIDALSSIIDNKTKENNKLENQLKVNIDTIKNIVSKLNLHYSSSSNKDYIVSNMFIASDDEEGEQLLNFIKSLGIDIK